MGTTGRRIVADYLPCRWCILLADHLGPSLREVLLAKIVRLRVDHRHVNSMRQPLLGSPPVEWLRALLLCFAPRGDNVVSEGKALRLSRLGLSGLPLLSERGWASLPIPPTTPHPGNLRMSALEHVEMVFHHAERGVSADLDQKLQTGGGWADALTPRPLHSSCGRMSSVEVVPSRFSP